MTKKPKKPSGVLKTFYRMTEENSVNSVLETVLTDFEPQNKALAIAIDCKESTAVEMLKRKDLKYNTDPKNLVQWYIKNSRNPDKYDFGSFLINMWVHCRRIRHYLEKGDPESAVLSALDLEKEEARGHKFVADLGWKAMQSRKKLQTMPAQTANQRKKREKIDLLLSILESRGLTPISINGMRTEKMLVFSLMNEELKMQGKKEIKKPTYHGYLRELRENNLDDVIENN